MTEPKRRPGRPKGSKNKPCSGVSVRVPPNCPKCLSTEIRARPGAKPFTRMIDYRLPNGILYPGVRWIPSQCSTCGTCLVVKEPVGEPIKTIAASINTSK